MKTRTIAIPHDYVWLSQNSRDPGKKFKQYVAAYVRHNYPGWQLKRIAKMKALIEKEKVSS